MAFCTACGASLPEAAAFCPRCGTSVVREGTAASAAEAMPGNDRPQAAPSLSQNLAAMLCYSFIAAIVFLLVEPYNRNRFIRFHAFQAILFTAAWVIVHGVVTIPIVGWALWPMVELAFLICWIVLLIKAYQGVMFKIPVIGEFAEQHA